MKVLKDWNGEPLEVGDWITYGWYNLDTRKVSFETARVLEMDYLNNSILIDKGTDDWLELDYHDVELSFHVIIEE